MMLYSVLIRNTLVLNCSLLNGMTPLALLGYIRLTTAAVLRCAPAVGEHCCTCNMYKEYQLPN